MKELPIIFRNEKYYIIEKFNILEISLTNIYGGGYYTEFPISKLEHREKNKTKACVEVIEEKETGYIKFLIWDDWGGLHKIEIPDYMQDEINFAISEAKRQNLFMPTK